MSHGYGGVLTMMVASRRFSAAGQFTGLLLASGCGNGHAQQWPGIRPFRAEVVVADARRPDTMFTIAGLDERPLYRLECHTFGYVNPDFDYSGDFECRLTSLYSTESYSTLLTENPEQSRDWESRGRFLVEELVGKCADYPEFGRVRHFRLRRMRLTLALSESVFDTLARAGNEHRGLKSFRFTFVAEPDNEAVSSIAEPTPYREPPYVDPDGSFERACEVVLPRGSRDVARPGEARRPS